MTKFKVLMADSNPQMLSMMKEYFTAQENVSVFDTVTDGVSALEALHKTRYDVLITELIMPRADGFEIMERIAAGLVSDAPAVMVVSTMRSEDMVRRNSAGGLSYGWNWLDQGVGIDGIYGGSRFAFGVTGLKAGISLVPAMVGLFGLSEAFASLADPESHAIANVKNVTIGDLFGYMKESFGMLRHHLKLVISSAVIGTVIGAIPGTGEDIASWVASDSARRGSKEKEKFGHGSWEGLIASETANNACTSGVFIPMLTLGIAGDAVSAILLGGLQLHGYQTGPNFMTDNPNFIYFIGVLLLLVNIMFMLEGTLITPVIGKVLQIRVGIIMPIVVVLSVIGAYAANVRKFDITVMVVFGFIGFLFKKLHISPAPMALGIILGSLVELNYRRGLMAGKYSLSLFLTRPVSAALAILLVIFVVLPIIRDKRSKAKSKTE